MRGGLHAHSYAEGGRNVLLLHGTAASHATWRRLVPHLEADLALLAPDLPGHARSQHVDQGLDIAGMAAHLDDFVRERALRPELVIAHSSGAAVATRWLARSDHAVRGVVYISPALRPFRGMRALAYPLGAKLASHAGPFMRWFAAQGGEAERVERLLIDMGCRVDDDMVRAYTELFSQPGHLRCVFEMMARWRLQDLAPTLPRHRLPTLLLGGMDDLAVPADDLRWLRREWPHAQLKLLPDCGHLAHEELPARVGHLITQWCRELQPVATEASA